MGVEKPLAERSVRETLKFPWQFEQTDDFDYMTHQRVEASFSTAKRLEADYLKVRAGRNSSLSPRNAVA